MFEMTPTVWLVLLVGAVILVLAGVFAWYARDPYPPIEDDGPI